MVTASLGRPYTSGICSIFPLSKESNVLEKSTNNSVASRFFGHTPLRIQRLVRICDAVDVTFLKEEDAAFHPFFNYN